MTLIASQRITTIFRSGLGCFAGFGAAGFILFAVGQSLIDYDDDDVVDWTVNYFKYGAAAFWLLVCSLGTIAGWVTGRLFAEDYSPTDQR